MTNQTKNSMLLMLCALIWGTAFVAQSAGSGMGAFSFLAGRSWMAVLVLIPTVKAFDALHHRQGRPDGKPKTAAERKQLLKDYNILTAGDGEEALQVLADHTIHLVVSDIMMEPMDGMTLLKNIKQSAAFSHIPVVLLTAVTSDSAKLEGMENGADAYIVKPFSINYLAETVATLLRQREDVKKAFAQSPFVGSETVSISTADTDFLAKLKEAVRKNIDNSSFNVDMLASELNMSRSSLNRKIRGTLDISPNNYIRIERLKMAATLLKEGRSKVNEVCYMVGFTSPSYFTKCFYQQFGLLPKDFNK